MKLVTAIIQPFMLDRLARELRKQPISGYTTAEVKGSGTDMINTARYLEDRVKVEVAVVDEDVDKIIDIITRTVGTHTEGDGIIFVTPVLRVVDIQNGKIDDAALRPL